NSSLLSLRYDLPPLRRSLQMTCSSGIERFFNGLALRCGAGPSERIRTSLDLVKQELFSASGGRSLLMSWPQRRQKVAERAGGIRSLLVGSGHNTEEPYKK